MNENLEEKIIKLLKLQKEVPELEIEIDNEKKDYDSNKLIFDNIKSIARHININYGYYGGEMYFTCKVSFNKLLINSLSQFYLDNNTKLKIPFTEIYLTIYSDYLLYQFRSKEELSKILAFFNVDNSKIKVEISDTFVEAYKEFTDAIYEYNLELL